MYLEANKNISTILTRSTNPRKAAFWRLFFVSVTVTIIPVCSLTLALIAFPSPNVARSEYTFIFHFLRGEENNFP